jgi:hypothetical protein
VIYVSNKEEIFARLNGTDDGRELAIEFMQRHRLVEREDLVPRPVRHLSPKMRLAWLGTAAQRMHEHRQLNERHSV